MERERESERQRYMFYMYHMYYYNVSALGSSAPHAQASAFLTTGAPVPSLTVLRGKQRDPDPKG